MPRIAGVHHSVTFLGIAYRAASLSHSNPVFVAVVAVGRAVRVVLRMAG
jgi:hypothetical protein